MMPIVLLTFIILNHDRPLGMRSLAGVIYCYFRIVIKAECVKSIDLNLNVFPYRT